MSINLNLLSLWSEKHLVEKQIYTSKRVAVWIKMKLNRSCVGGWRVISLKFGANGSKRFSLQNVADYGPPHFLVTCSSYNFFVFMLFQTNALLPSIYLRSSSTLRAAFSLHLSLKLSRKYHIFQALLPRYVPQKIQLPIPYVHMHPFCFHFL